MGERVYKKKGRMKESDIFIEVDCFQKNKAGNIVCGDSYMSQKLKEEDRLAEAGRPDHQCIIGRFREWYQSQCFIGDDRYYGHELHSHERKYPPNRSLDYPYPA